jgi:quinol monooxygenase YgiN
MFLQAVRLQISPDHLWAFRKLYEQSMIPELQGAVGCLYAALVRGDETEEDVVALALWDEEKSAGQHEAKSGFPELIEQSKGYMADSSNYKIRLSPDMQLEYSPEPRQPVFRSYSVALHSDVSRLLRGTAPMTFLRVVSVHVRPDMADEFIRIYERDIAPTLLALSGCRFNLLVTNTQDRSEHLSVTLWDSPQNADVYEEDGTFNRLTEKLKHTFSTLYQWKLGLEQEPGKQAATSEDLVVRTYHVLLARSMQGLL